MPPRRGRHVRPGAGEGMRHGREGGPFLLGLTATPWRADEADLEGIFGHPLVAIDMVTGLNQGFLANVDYRMYTDNIRWDALPLLQGERLSPRRIEPDPVHQGVGRWRGAGAGGGPQLPSLAAYKESSRGPIQLNGRNSVNSR